MRSLSSVSTTVLPPSVSFTVSDAGAAESWIRSEILTGDAVLDEQDLLVSHSPDDDPDEELSGDVEGYYFAFTAGEDHYHVIVKDVLW